MNFQNSRLVVLCPCCGAELPIMVNGRGDILRSASDKQVAFIKKLARSCHMEIDTDGLSSGQAKDIIESLLERR